VKSEGRLLMKIVSLNVGLPREVNWHGRRVTTGIFKEPVAGRVMMRKLDLDGDRQADLTVHGGEYKAVYCYPVEHYRYWKKELPGRELPMGMFGENFTTEGMLENELHLGDRFSVGSGSVLTNPKVKMGSAEVVVTQPRLPCYKLGVRFGADDMVKRFLASGRTGFYLAVTREGEVGAGDKIAVIAREANAVPVSEITRLYVAKRFGPEDLDSLRRAMKIETLPEYWKGYFQERLHKMNV
jgi:MOSC domain-containing protein YiiM